MRRIAWIVAAIGATTLGCAGRTWIASPTGDGHAWFKITCPWGSDGCFEQASEACPGGYEIDQRHTKAGKPRNFSAWRSTLVRCTSGEAPAQTTAAAPADSKPSTKGDEWTTHRAARWSLSTPRAWAMSTAGKTKRFEDPDRRHEASLLAQKWDDSLEAFAAAQFEGWHSSKPIEVGTKIAIRGTDFDGTSQTTAIVMVVDGIGYRVSCVDLDAASTSKVCTKVLRSFRVKDATDE